MNLDFRSDKALLGARTFAGGRNDSYICVGCSYAQFFAVQPGAFCTAADSVCVGKPVPLIQPACADYVTRPQVDMALAAPLAGHARES